MKWKVVFYDHEGTIKEVELTNEYKNPDDAYQEAGEVANYEFLHGSERLYEDWIIVPV